MGRLALQGVMCHHNFTCVASVPWICSDDISDHLCERVLSVLFGIWLMACNKCFPSPSLWKTFRNMCIYWRHHEALVVQWHKVNHVLTAHMIRTMYGPTYPQLVVCE